MKELNDIDVMSLADVEVTLARTYGHLEELRSHKN